MSTKDELRAQADEAKVDFANIVNEVTGKKPTEYQIQAADHFANQVMIGRKKENPSMTEEEVKKELVSLKLEALRTGDLKQLSDEMTADLKDPSRMAKMQNTSGLIAQVFKNERE
jgi:hypothetical protein